VARLSALDHLAVIVAVTAVAMMEVPVDQIVGMVAVRNLFVTASVGVLVGRLVAGTGVLRRTVGRVRSRHWQHVLVDMALVNVMQMALVQVVFVALVLDGGMAAVGPVGVAMFVMDVMC
jgi:hypothetical protein